MKIKRKNEPKNDKKIKNKKKERLTAKR